MVASTTVGTGFRSRCGRKPIKIMLVDDHAVVRAGVRRLLEQDTAYQVIAEAGSDERACALYQLHHPDVIVLDLSMPGTGGLELIRRILDQASDARILVYSMHEDASLVERSIRLGARGYVTKGSAPEVLAVAIGEVAAGQLFLSADVASSIAFLRLAANDNPAEHLSPRELEVLRLLVTGRPLSDIAGTLRLTVAAVANCRALIKQKLHIGDDMELIMLALQRHLA
jgi:two-component system invasion response regulator UvrY